MDNLQHLAPEAVATPDRRRPEIGTSNNIPVTVSGRQASPTCAFCAVVQSVHANQPTIVVEFSLSLCECRGGDGVSDEVSGER